jgi:dihydrofolate synthase/folylpolyglutamate synthase
LKAENNFIQYEDGQGSIILPEPNILGNHQLANISTSVATARKLFNIKDQDIKTGITKIELKGRLQEIKSGKLKNLVGLNRLICDGAHNINAAKAIANWIKQQNQDVHLIVGMMKDKDHQGFIKCFKDIVKSITLIDIPNQEGSISKEELKNKINGIQKEINLNNSIKESIQLINKYQNNICLVIGSLYLVGEVLNLN